MTASAPSGPRAVNRLGVDEAVDYWNSRHRKTGELASGGDGAYDEAVNQVFYYVRLGRLLDILGDTTEAASPLRVLDAGCGKGWFTRALAGCGHQVDGIDSSEHAVAACRARSVGRDRYAVSRLDEWAPPYLYDAVVSVDVLFHLMDEQAWEASVRNLAGLVRWGGRLVVSDHDAAEDRLWQTYQVTRAGSRYRELLLPLGFTYDGFVPYQFRLSPAGFHTFTRIA